MFYRSGGSGTGRYLRIGVANEQGRTVAQDVEVLIGRVTEVPRDSTLPVRRIIDISTPALTWTHSDSPRQTIGARVTRYVDLGVEYEEGPANLVGYFGLKFDPPPADERHLLVTGTYDIVLVLSSRDTNALFYKVRLAFNPGTNTLTLVDKPKRVSAVDD